jgi:ABC-type lipoprotein export system ATPase subunit
MNDKSLSKFRNLNLGLSLQFHQLLPEFTALENVYTGFHCYKPKQETEAEAKKLLDFLDYHTGLTINLMLSGGNNSESQWHVR